MSCQTKCRQNDDCNVWSFSKNSKDCYLLTEAKEATINKCNPENCKRGPKECPSNDNGELKTYPKYWMGFWEANILK